MEKTTSYFERFIKLHRDFISVKVVDINFVRSMVVAKYKWGYLIETEYVDDDWIMTLETLASSDGKTAVLIDRDRFGGEHNEMRTYPRDSHFPIGCRVRLVKNVA